MTWQQTVLFAPGCLLAVLTLLVLVAVFTRRPGGGWQIGPAWPGRATGRLMRELFDVGEPDWWTRRGQKRMRAGKPVATDGRPPPVWL